MLDFGGAPTNANRRSVTPLSIFRGIFRISKSLMIIGECQGGLRFNSRVKSANEVKGGLIPTSVNLKSERCRRRRFIGKKKYGDYIIKGGPW